MIILTWHTIAGLSKWMVKEAVSLGIDPITKSQQSANKRHRLRPSEKTVEAEPNPLPYLPFRLSDKIIRQPWDKRDDMVDGS